MSRSSALSNHAVNAWRQIGPVASAGRGSGALAICAKVIATPCSVDHTVRR